MRKFTTLLIAFSISSLLFVGCSGSKDNDEKTTEEQTTSKPSEEVAANPMDNKGIGPVSSVTLGEINKEMAAQGETIFTDKCTACHKADANFTGPAPKGILDRRSPEWVMNMILNPVQMVQEDPIAKKLMMEFNGSQMANQNLTEEEARKVLEYFRTL
ncbi:MAG: cytochrome c [Flavobacteriales bacterium]|nr:cytochrome c [Flavobacteriales bacterium]